MANILILETSGIVQGNVHWMVPRAINSLFTGRDNLLVRIEKALYIDSPSTIETQRKFVITGLGGQGKSEICLQVANLMREKYVLIALLTHSLLS